MGLQTLLMGTANQTGPSGMTYVFSYHDDRGDDRYHTGYDMKVLSMVEGFGFRAPFSETRKKRIFLLFYPTLLYPTIPPGTEGNNQFQFLAARTNLVGYCILDISLVSSLLFIRYTLSLRKLLLTYEVFPHGKVRRNPVPCTGKCPVIQEFRSLTHGLGRSLSLLKFQSLNCEGGWSPPAMTSGAANSESS